MTDPTPKAVVVPVEQVREWKRKAEGRFMTSSLSEYCPKEFIELADAYLALAAAPQASLPPVEGVREGDVHTRLMEVVSAEVFRQQPDTFTEDNDFDLVIPSGVTPATAFVKIDVSSIAEAILPHVQSRANPLTGAAERVEKFLGSVRGLIRQEGHTLDPNDIRSLLSRTPALSPVPSGGGEPVAWRRRVIEAETGPGRERVLYGPEDAGFYNGKTDRYVIEPLYADPVPAVEAGWIVGNGDADQWRTWADGYSAWTEDRELATRYARREDAEAVHRDDDDAWRVVPYAPSAPGEAPASPPAETGEGLTDDEVCRIAESIRQSSVAWANEPEQFAHLIELTPAELREFAQRYLSAQPVSPSEGEGEARGDAWSDFESEHLTDGKGHAAADVYAHCRVVFDAAWPQGRDGAIAAATAALPSGWPTVKITHPASDQSDTERMKAALEPFAALADKFGCWSMVEVCAPDPGNPSPVIQPVPLAAFESAAAALAALAEKAADKSAATGEA